MEWSPNLMFDRKLMAPSILEIEYASNAKSRQILSPKLFGSLEIRNEFNSGFRILSFTNCKLNQRKSKDHHPSTH